MNTHTLWHMMDLFAQGNVKNPPKTPKTSCMHYSYTSAHFLLTCKSLAMRRGLLHRTLFEGHYGMWQDVIQSCNTSGLSGARSAAFLWIPQTEEERKNAREGSVLECSSSSIGYLDRWKANYWVGFLTVCWKERARWWHLQTANKAVRQNTPRYGYTSLNMTTPKCITRHSQKQLKCSVRPALSPHSSILSNSTTC